MVTTSYADACASVAELIDRVTEDREPVIITRRGQASVAPIAVDE
jgi:prevent-host-death family protein